MRYPRALLAVALTSLLSAPGVAPERGAALAGTPAAVKAARLPTGVPPAALRAEPALPVPDGWPFADAFPRTAGAGRLIGGAFEWTDFIYDDRGAPGTPVGRPATPFAPSRGTYEYGSPAAANNGADIFRVGIGLDPYASYWRVDWNTLVDPGVPIAAFAIDSDSAAATGGAEWPAGAGIRSAGIDRALVLSAKGAWLVDVGTGARVALGIPSVDVDARSFVLRVPREVIEPAGTWRVRVAAGVANADGDGFAPIPETLGAPPGGPAVYNVGFRTYEHERTLGTSGGLRNWWMEHAQAAALASRDVSAFAADLDWSALAVRATTPEPLPTGWTNRWYVSSIELGQGIVRDSSQMQDTRPNYLGRVQPYGVYVPTTYDGITPTPLTWLLHSAFQPHTAFAVVTPNFVQQACEQRRSICATPLGRGHDGWYLDEAELDLWEVWGRLGDTYALDTERTVLAGFSMGGYAAYKLGLAHPDLFARAVVIAATPICGERFGPGVDRPRAPGRCTTDGDTRPMVENARWLPFYIAHGTADELLPIGGTVDQVAAFDRLNLRYRFEHYLGQPHIPWYLQDRWRPAAEQMGNSVREVDPGTVTLRWYPNLDRPEWGIGVSSAYWLDALTAREIAPGVTARVHARSRARPDAAITPQRTTEEEARSDASPAVVTELTWQVGIAPVPEPRVDLDLANVSSVRVDLARAGLRRGAPAEVVVGTDGAATVVLTGVSGRVTLDGTFVGVADGVHPFAVAVPQGSHSIRIGP